MVRNSEKFPTIVHLAVVRLSKRSRKHNGDTSWERCRRISGCSNRRVIDGQLVNCAAVNASLAEDCVVTSLSPILISHAPFMLECHFFHFSGRSAGGHTSCQVYLTAVFVHAKTGSRMCVQVKLTKVQQLFKCLNVGVR